MIKIICLVLGFSTSAFAGQINLNSGDSITIQPNTMTTVTCNGTSSGINCNQQLSAFQALLRSCEENYTAGDCINRMWPNFKSANRECVAMATPTCLEACEQNYTGGQCAVTCQ